MTQKDIDYAKYIVSRFLRDKRELEGYREDLEQEACISLLRAQESFDPSKGSELDLHIFMRVTYALRDYVKQQAKHFRKAEVDHESQHWDLSGPLDVDEIADDEVEPHAMDLRDIVDKLDLTDRQHIVLSTWLETGEITETAKRLGCSQPYVTQVIARIIEMSREVLILSGTSV